MKFIFHNLKIIIYQKNWWDHVERNEEHRIPKIFYMYHTLRSENEKEQGL
jgi:hypothetical protein